MILLLVGLLLALLGVFAGAVLVVVPLGLAAWTAGTTLWVLFPLFCIAGFVLFLLGARTHQMRGATVALSGLMLLLAGASALGLVMSAAGIVAVTGSTLSLWYVLAVAGALGVAGAAALNRDPDAA